VQLHLGGCGHSGASKFTPIPLGSKAKKGAQRERGPEKGAGREPHRGADSGVLGSPKSAIAGLGLAEKIKGHRTVVPGTGAALPPSSGGKLGLHLPVPVPVSINRKSGVTRPRRGAATIILCDAGAVIT
jgi:hypothetical protein